ncbi:MAG: FtsW/RodA/SpoVE family cell cycle protein [Actinomycetes bacterium]
MSAATPAAPAARGSGAGFPPTPPARARERELLALAWLVVVGASVLLAWSTSPELPRSVLVDALSFGALATAAHLVVRRVAPAADPLLLPLTFLLNGLGLVFIRRIDLAVGSQLAPAQTTWTIVAGVAFVATLVAVRDVRDLSRFTYSFGLATLVLLALPLVPGLGQRVRGAQLWIELFGLTFQPGEVAKVTMVVFLAGYLERKRALLSVATQRVGPLLLPPARHLGPVLSAVGLALVIMVAQRDLGPGLLLLGVAVALLYVATGRLAYPLIGLAAFSLGAFLATRLFGHVRLRIDIWLRPFADPQGDGYQLVQSLFALGTGGLTGVGLGLGRPSDIPVAATDAIFAVIGEELGMLGATAVLLAFLLLVARGLRIAMAQRDEFATLLAVGLATIVGLQVFLIVGGITRLVPLTGITLPWVSYGGSSLLANAMLLALLVRMSDSAAGAGASRGGRS